MTPCGAAVAGAYVTAAPQPALASLARAADSDRPRTDGTRTLPLWTEDVPDASPSERTRSTTVPAFTCVPASGNWLTTVPTAPEDTSETVSYTHLTLPTNREV